MTPELSPSEQDAARRRWLPLLLAGLVILLALVAYAVRHSTTSAATPEDCEKKPPPNAFAVAECDDGSAPPAGAKPGTPDRTAPAPAKP